MTGPHPRPVSLQLTAVDILGRIVLCGGGLLCALRGVEQHPWTLLWRCQQQCPSLVMNKNNSWMADSPQVENYCSWPTQESGGRVGTEPLFFTLSSLPPADCSIQPGLNLWMWLDADVQRELWKLERAAVDLGFGPRWSWGREGRQRPHLIKEVLNSCPQICSSLPPATQPRSHQYIGILLGGYKCPIWVLF